MNIPSDTQEPRLHDADGACEAVSDVLGTGSNMVAEGGCRWLHRYSAIRLCRYSGIRMGALAQASMLGVSYACSDSGAHSLDSHVLMAAATHQSVKLKEDVDDAFLVEYRTWLAIGTGHCALQGGLVTGCSPTPPASYA